MNLKHAFAFLLLICIGSIPLKSRAVGIEFNHGSWAEFNLSGCSDQERNLYTFKSGQVLTAGNNDPLWDDAYANIYVYNAVANNILNVPDGTKEQREAKYAEALVGRAFEYLNLVNILVITMTLRQPLPITEYLSC